MPIYRTQYERFNFGFDPCLKQVADVVFELDVPNDDAHAGQINEAAYATLMEQNPKWNDYTAPVEGHSGWSSIMGGYKIEEVIDVDLDFCLGEAGEGKPRIAETFKRNDKPDGKHAWENSYRVTGFYKTYVPPKREPNLTDNLLAEILAEERKAMTATERARADKKMKVIPCSRKEAEFVSGAGVGGCIARLKDVTVTGRVNWEVRTIARARRDYKVHDDYPTEIYKYWVK